MNDPCPSPSTGPSAGRAADPGSRREVGGVLVVDVAAARTTVVLRGEIDAASAPLLDELRHAAVETGHSVVVDVTAVPFMDSSGVAFLVRLLRGVGSGRVAVLGPRPQVSHLLEVTQLVSVVEVLTDGTG